MDGQKFFKRNCMVMGKPNFKEEGELRQEIRLNVPPLEWTSNYIDNRLTFNEHVEYINIKTPKKVNLLYKLRKVISRGGKELLFKSIETPHLRCCSTILTMVNKKEIVNLRKKL